MTDLPPPPYSEHDNSPVPVIPVVPAPIPSIPQVSGGLNNEQKNVLEKVLLGQHVLITGAAGTGKSFLVKSICSQLDKRGKVYRILAPTGVAALNVEGQTIHRFLGLRPGIDTIQDYIKICSKRSKVPWDVITAIIIDEVSMFHPKLFELFSEICQYHKKSRNAFGGIQMIFLGDFFQLCPIRNKDDKPDDPDYIFETTLWKKMNISVHILQQVMRQNEKDFVEALSHLRVGNLSDKLLEMLERCKNNKKIFGKHYVQLFSLNVDKNHGNESQLARLKTNSKVFRALDIGDVNCLKGCRAEKEVLLKIGAMVMLLWNIQEQGLCNGSVGILQEFDNTGMPVVAFDNGVTTVITKRKWEVKERFSGGTKLIAARTQIPLAVAYCVSTHKSQGMTIEYLVADCKGIFTTGQLYVMLSRAKTAKGLIIKNFVPDTIMVDSKVHQFYAEHEEEEQEVEENVL